MAFLSNDVFDDGLNTLTTNGTRVDICSQQPTTYTEATSTYSLGNGTAVSIGAPADRTGGGREVTVPSVVNQAVTATGTATHYAITDPSTNTLLATAALTTSQAVTSGNNFTISTFTIGMPDPS